MLEDALGRKLDHPAFHSHLYGIGFVQDDPALLSQQLEWARSRSEFVALNWQADAASARGQLARAKALYSAAIGQAERGKAIREAGRIAAEAALTQAAFGRCDEAMRFVAERQRHLQTPSGGEALVLAVCGQPRRAEIILDTGYDAARGHEAE